MNSVPALPLTPSLAERRIALLARIHAARDETAQVGRLLIDDVHATERSRRAVLAGWTLLKASAVAGGVIWSLNATSNMGRSRRFFTLAVSLLSTLRAIRRVGALLLPLATSTRRQG